MTDLPSIHDPAAEQAAEAYAADVRMRLPAELTSARQARAAIRQALAAWGMDHLSDDAQLLGSELIANAVEHSDGNPIGLALQRHTGTDGRPGIICEVIDTTAQLPQEQQSAQPDDEGGRGLAIVSALARSSGVCTSQSGKTSWFTLGSSTAPTASLVRSTTSPEPTAGGSSAPQAVLRGHRQRRPGANGHHPDAWTSCIGMGGRPGIRGCATGRPAVPSLWARS